MRWSYRFLISGRIPLFLLVLATLVPAAQILLRLQTDNTIDTFLAQDDPNLAFYRETSSMFGGDCILYITIEASEGSIFSLEWLARIDRISTTVGDVEGMEKVISLTTADAVVRVDDTVFVGPLLNRFPKTQQEVARFEQRVLSSPLLRRLVSSDRSSSVLMAYMDQKMLEDPTRQNETVRAVQRCLETEQPREGRIRLTGNPVIAEAIEHYSSRDERIFSSLMILLVAFSGLLILRRLSAMILPVLVVLVTVSWTMSLFVLTGHQTNWVTSIIPPILLLVGVASSIHFLFRYQTDLSRGITRREAAVETFRAITVPCFFTSLTTAVGFGSLMVSQVMPVRVFGTFASLGILVSFVATMSIAPTVLCLGKTGRAAAGSWSNERFRLLDGIDRLIKGRPGTVVVMAALITLVLTLGVLRIRVETNVLKYFRQDTRVVQDALIIDRIFGGTSPLDIVVDTGRVQGAMEPKVLRDVAMLQDRYEEMAEVSHGLSIADLVQEIHRAVVGDKETQDIPETRQAVSQLLLTFTRPENLEPMTDPDRRRLRITTQFMGATLGAGQARRLIDEIRDVPKGLFSEEVNVRFTGFPILFLNMDRYLVRSQVYSLGIVLLVLATLMMVLFRSVRIGLAGMIPNVAPIAVVFGLMGWLDVPLDGFTVMIASIAIGIGMDDTIHFLHRLRSELSGGTDLAGAITETLQGVGRPVLFTSVVLALGFWVFCLSDFVGTRNFGFLTGVTVLVALIADLLMLPAVLQMIGIPKRWSSVEPVREFT